MPRLVEYGEIYSSEFVLRPVGQKFKLFFTIPRLQFTSDVLSAENTGLYLFIYLSMHRTTRERLHIRRPSHAIAAS